MSETEKRRARRERCAAKYAARSFAEGVRASASGHNGHSGVAYGVGGGLVNVPAVAARSKTPLWSPSRRSRPAQSPKSTESATSEALELLVRP